MQAFFSFGRDELELISRRRGDKLVHIVDSPDGQLFELQSDPGEMKNLWSDAGRASGALVGGTPSMGERRAAGRHVQAVAGSAATCPRAAGCGDAYFALGIGVWLEDRTSRRRDSRSHY
jgi:hypothetical protein